MEFRTVTTSTSGQDMPKVARNLRARSFRRKIPLNAELCSIVAGTNNHKFLANPAAQNVYLFLVDYVCELSQRLFSRDLRELRILDWGCGKGHITLLLQQLGARVISADRHVDVADSAFGQATPIMKRKDIRVVGLEHDYLLPFANKSFDVVLSFGVLEHVPNDIASLKEIHRVLDTHGLLFVFFLPYILSWTQALSRAGGESYHDRLYNRGKVERLLREGQFELLDFWHRQLLPKNRVRYPSYRAVERIDQWLTDHTPLKYFATNVEFAARKLDPVVPGI